MADIYTVNKTANGVELEFESGKTLFSYNDGKLIIEVEDPTREIKFSVDETSLVVDLIRGDL